MEQNIVSGIILLLVMLVAVSCSKDETEPSATPNTAPKTASNVEPNVVNQADAEKARRALIAMVEASSDPILKSNLENLSKRFESGNLAVDHYDVFIGGWQLNLHDRSWGLIIRNGNQLFTYDGTFEVHNDGEWKALLINVGNGSGTEMPSH